MPRPKLHDDALRVRLLEQAVRTLSKEGPDGLSLRKLAAQVGTSTTAVYSLFGGKPGLLNAVFDEAFDRFAQRLGTVEHVDDLIEQGIALAAAYRSSALDEPHFYQVMFGQVGGELTPDEESVRRATATFTPLVEWVRQAMDAGLLREENPRTVATTMWSVMHGLVSLELRSLLPPGSGEPAELYRHALRAMLRGWHP
ncbi:TetR/AcrR family transcriptional regulator [Pseudonocardia spinosispora]|uniref:TetR/AcrR family transcriptional regulator n=1 Tax=Pseudonocardia spinosispora TaxID=103441 RepID=UPI00048D543E|nr:TetR-like C-terminal domain-containing protein [Pseudonocardia spinosispora]